MEFLIVVLVYLVVVTVVGWLFYKWGAHIAESKGRSRSLGWWAVFFGLLAILVLYLLPDQLGTTQYTPAQPAVRQPNVSERLEKLALLRDKGVLTQEEFERAKADALAAR